MTEETIANPFETTAGNNINNYPTIQEETTTDDRTSKDIKMMTTITMTTTTTTTMTTVATRIDGNKNKN